jgi:hypothetical protein
MPSSIASRLFVACLAVVSAVAAPSAQTRQPGIPAARGDRSDRRAYLSRRRTAGFAPEQIKPTQVNPFDFDAFWDAAGGGWCRARRHPGSD